MQSKPVVVAVALLALAQATPKNLLSSIRLRRAEIFGRAPDGTQPKVLPPELGTPTVQGCFSSSGNLTLNSTPTYNSIDGCANKVCRPAGFPVGGTTGGNQCWCGTTYPPKDTLVDPSHCTTSCNSYPSEACGGDGFWTIYNTGLDLNVKYQPNSTTDNQSSTSSSSTTSPTEAATKPATTVRVTETASAQPTADSSGGGGGPNVGGIVAGVVVSVIVVLSVVGGGFFYLRRRRNREIEEEYRRNAAVNNFLGKPPGSSGGMSSMDSRLDPVMVQRRLSDGSIADNQDYSRRILRVTNA
ncbi:dec1b5a7-f689-42f3-a7d4-a28795f4e23b [Thermothielavioides terrestris]|uniref:WSC domain-containing protein n=2 Tax=Thermothielavioides terrestris TaxID=2587410 RepID=G2R8Q4_THETT|nr:uncharacterized protein THITE_132098 [Thermothielavioides terrestris NRRL 8126]AEO68270.1 hypothetical protein THITE_132098 [Thermothielavioides terrestris NRRL 8126]SPQ24474.1 dec1b5a7-f689-42f3-a7d4-a28795f4e23b [Thermothielavioides terrestris]